MNDYKRCKKQLASLKAENRKLTFSSKVMQFVLYVVSTYDENDNRIDITQEICVTCM